MRVRFVGGPWHNKVPLILNPVRVFNVPILLTEETDAGLLVRESSEQYTLEEFTYGFRIVYCQYIHSSLYDASGVPMPCTCHEDLPVMHGLLVDDDYLSRPWTIASINAESFGVKIDPSWLGKFLEPPIDLDFTDQESD